MVAKTRSAQAGVAVGVGATDGLGDDVDDGAAADPHAEPVATANKRIVASHHRVINCSYIQYGATMREDPLGRGPGEREGKLSGDAGGHRRTVTC